MPSPIIQNLWRRARKGENFFWSFGFWWFWDGRDGGGGCRSPIQEPRKRRFVLFYVRKPGEICPHERQVYNTMQAGIHSCGANCDRATLGRSLGERTGRTSGVATETVRGVIGLGEETERPSRVVSTLGNGDRVKTVRGRTCATGPMLCAALYRAIGI